MTASTHYYFYAITTVQFQSENMYILSITKNLKEKLIKFNKLYPPEHKYNTLYAIYSNSVIYTDDELETNKSTFRKFFESYEIHGIPRKHRWYRISFKELTSKFQEFTKSIALDIKFTMDYNIDMINPEPSKTNVINNIDDSIKDKSNNEDCHSTSVSEISESYDANPVPTEDLKCLNSEVINDIVSVSEVSSPRMIVSPSADLKSDIRNDILYYLINNGMTHMVKYLVESLNFELQCKEFNIVPNKQYMSIIEYLLCKGIKPKDKDIEYLVVHADMEFLMCLSKYGIVPNNTVYDTIYNIEPSNLNLIMFLLDHNVIPSADMISHYIGLTDNTIAKIIAKHPNTQQVLNRYHLGELFKKDYINIDEFAECIIYNKHEISDHVYVEKSNTENLCSNDIVGQSSTINTLTSWIFR